MKPAIAIAIYSEDTAFAQRWQQGLSAAAAEHYSDTPLAVLSAVDRNALSELLKRPDLQALAVHSANAAEIVPRCLKRRPHVNHFVVLPQTRRGHIDALLDLTIDGYLDDTDEDYFSALREILAAVSQKAATPFADTLRDYVQSARDAWHTPGHSGGDSMKDSPWVADFYRFMGEHIFDADLSVSVHMLDSLLEPHSVIQQAQNLAARAFGARHTFFATNGTSTANKVILQSLLHPGDKVLLDRGSHKSAHHGVILCGAMPVYLRSSLRVRYGLYGPVTQACIFDAIEQHPDARALLLTSCTYDGMRYDLAPIVQRAHAHGIKVIIDEAWYAHAAFHHALRPTALEFGADYVTQSTHKMLSAFSQASMIHVRDPDFDEQRFREHFNMHASTSPLYAIIASMDVARKQMSMEGFGLLSRTLELAERLRDSINATGVFRVLELPDMLPDELAEDGIRLDPTKLTVDISRTGMRAEAVQVELFEKYNIQVEKTTFNTITLLLTIGTTLGKVMRLENALKRMARTAPGQRQGAVLEPPLPLPPPGDIARLPRDVFFERGQVVPLMNSQTQLNAALEGAISADQITPYPPGVPVLVPGQVISRDVLEYLRSMLLSQRHVEVHGLSRRGDLPHLRIAKDPSPDGETPAAGSPAAAAGSAPQHDVLQAATADPNENRTGADR
ncbi:MAG: aminotransferase class V-fold PLP-dependent enzyme [Halieaceae bacterium]|jgi:arginine decarboxylase|nr:aminotransferase class V-fold PLP-dependent enzyme [Halieaceae bacterium]